jgi:hypothetical protein
MFASAVPLATASSSAASPRSIPFTSTLAAFKPREAARLNASRTHPSPVCERSFMTLAASVGARQSRESTILDDLLKGFSGVLVSDFYAAYDSVPCAQQKCLIHLMRDINEDLYKNPFDEDLKEIARRFGILLREIVVTVDTVA